MDFEAKTFLKSLPETPGVYRMLGADDTVLYVGKAKNLKRRVSSYFQRTLTSPRISLMVAQIARIEITLTRSEAEALILENNLIKSLSPRYNILFRDDKSYPYIALTGDAFPRLAYHRGALSKGVRYFGPYPNAWAVRESMHLLQKIFRLRTCENTVYANRSRPCLLYQIKRCTGPCVELIDEKTYAEDVRMATFFLNGRTTEVVDNLGEQMSTAAVALDFEKAAFFRDQIRTLQKVLHRQHVDSNQDEDVDVIVAVEESGVVCVNLAMIRGGRHLGDRPQFPSNANEMAALDVLLAFIEQHYEEQNLPSRLVLNIGVDEGRSLFEALALTGCQVVLPRGEGERAWVEMAEQNARLALTARARSGERIETRLEALREALSLDTPPQRIECFDISHTQGEATVASCVVCEGGSMKKSEYRRYNISGITAGDDYAAMRQALLRRYEKVAEGEGVAPDLILIDGGKGQVSAARAILSELGLDGLSMVGVAKGDGRKVGLERLIFPDDREPLALGGGHPALHLITEIRDEAHRFAISGHRARRSKARVGSKLEDIPGIGPTRRRALLAAFGGLDHVRNATVEDLCRVEGINRKMAESIYNALH